MNCYSCNQNIPPIIFRNRKEYIRVCECPYQKILLKDDIIRYYDIDYVNNKIEYRIRGHRSQDLNYSEMWTDTNNETNAPVYFKTKFVKISNFLDIHYVFKKLQKQSSFL